MTYAQNPSSNAREHGHPQSCCSKTIPTHIPVTKTCVASTPLGLTELPPPTHSCDLRLSDNKNTTRGEWFSPQTALQASVHE